MYINLFTATLLMSFVITIAPAFIFPGEHIATQSTIDCLLIGADTLPMVLWASKKETHREFPF